MLQQSEITLAEGDPLAKLYAEPELLLDGEYIPRAIELVKSAKTQIWICAYTWRWYEHAPEKLVQQFNYEIMRKVKAGLEVRALMHKRTEALRLREYGITTKILPTERTMHTKAICVDASRLLLGSHNLTDRGTAENYEASLYVEDCQATALFAVYYNRMWENYAAK